MKKIFIYITLILANSTLLAQSISDLTFGTDTTLEVITWNIEHFPKNGQTTIDSVSKIIEALDVDLLALQEISDTVLFKQMLNNLDGYQGYFKSGWYAGLAYIYKTEAIEINNIYEIYTTSPYWSAFPRSPMVMEMSFMGENLIIINNHFKCCGDGIIDHGDSSDEETRRLEASNLLKQYIDSNFPNERVMVLGDLNDILTDNEANNVFQSFIDDVDNYLFADIDIAFGNSSGWSYPGWPSHLDHILITNELFSEFEDDDSDIQTIKIEDYLNGGWSVYDANISDHRPVAIKIKPSLISGIFNENKFDFRLMNYPNPFKQETIISFNRMQEDAELEIYSIKGQKVDSITVTKGNTSVIWNAERFANGIYFAKLISNENVLATIKMILMK